MRSLAVSSLALLAIILSMAPTYGADAYLKPYFNLTVDLFHYQANMNTATSAMQAYGYKTTRLRQADPYTWQSTTRISSVVEFVSVAGTDNAAAMSNSKDLANALSHNYDTTFGNLKTFFSKEKLTLYSIKAILRTTTFQFSFSTKSWNDAGGGQIALEAMEKAVSTAIGITGCEALAEGSPAEGNGFTNITFQFYGSNGEACENKCLSIVEAGYPKTTWTSAFTANKLALSNVAWFVDKASPPPAPETGFGAWVKNHPEAVAGIIAGLVIIIFVIVLVCVHRRAKQAEKLRDTMEAMLGPEEHGQVQGGAGGAKRAPGGKRSGKKMPPGGKGPAPAPTPTGAAPAPQGGQKAVAAAPAPTQQQQAAPQVATSNGEGEGQLYGDSQPEVQQA